MYRDELDALNAIHLEQKRTNELLEKLVSEMLEPKVDPAPAEPLEPVESPAPSAPEPATIEPINGEEAADNAAKGRGRGNRGKGS